MTSTTLRRSIGSLCAIAAILLLPAHAKGFPEPEGYGKVKFGMSLAEVKAAYPEARQMGGEPHNDEGQHAPRWDFLELEGAKIEELGKCGLDFRFFQNELYEVQFRCPDRDKNLDYLQHKFGTPNRTSDKAWMWIGEKAAVTCNHHSGVFLFGDLKRSQLMQASLLKLMAKERAKTPVAAPPAQ